MHQTTVIERAENTIITEHHLPSPPPPALIVWNGANGSGKSTAHELLVKHGFGYAMKFSDRPPRHDQGVHRLGDAITCLTEVFDEFVQCPEVCVYQCGKNRYLHIPEQILYMLADHGAGTAITGDQLATVALRDRLDDKAHVVPCYVHTEPLIIEGRLRAAGYTEEQLVRRMNGSHAAATQYRKNPSFYTHVIDNNRDWQWFHDQVQELANSYQRGTEAA